MSGPEVERYFSARAVEFDRLYALPPFERALNRVFRRAVYQRFALTLEHAGDLTGKRVLDVGCGSGRLSVAMAQRGAAAVVGVDFAEDMLNLARKYANEAGVAERCRFVAADFSLYEDPMPFDVTIAIGFFDYVPSPAPLLARARKLTQGRLLASFPSPQPLRTQLRRWRYAKRGVALRFYERAEVDRLAREAGFARVQVLPLAAGHFLVADVK